MRIICTKCGAIYRIDPSRVKSTGTKVRCSLCHHIFTAYLEGSQAEGDPFSDLFSDRRIGEEAYLFTQAVWGPMGEA